MRPFLTQDQYSLYRLIWNRFVASQMTPATFDETTVDVTAADYTFRVKGTVPKFAGWMATYASATDERAPDATASDDTEGESLRSSARSGSELGVGPQRAEWKTTTPCPACCRRSPKAIGWS